MKTIYVVICQLFSYRKWKWVTQSCPTLCNTMDYGNSPGQNTGTGSLSLLQGMFPTQGSNPGLPQCRQILYQLSHQGSPRILEWVAHPFSSGSSRPRNRTGVSCIAGGFFTNWAMEKNTKIPMMVNTDEKLPRLQRVSLCNPNPLVPKPHRGSWLPWGGLLRLH